MGTTTETCRSIVGEVVFRARVAVSDTTDSEMGTLRDTGALPLGFFGAGSSSVSSSSASTSSSVSDRGEPLSSETSLSGSEAGPLPKRPMLYTPRGRVRFAPLPDPRRSVLVTESGDELPLPFDDPDMNRVPAAASVSCPAITKTESAPPMLGNKENEKDAQRVSREWTEQYASA